MHLSFPSGGGRIKEAGLQSAGKRLSVELFKVIGKGVQQRFGHDISDATAYVASELPVFLQITERALGLN